MGIGFDLLGGGFATIFVPLIIKLEPLHPFFTGWLQ
jgi:hypothetical protein